MYIINKLQVKALQEQLNQLRSMANEQIQQGKIKVAANNDDENNNTHIGNTPREPKNKAQVKANLAKKKSHKEKVRTWC